MANLPTDLLDQLIDTGNKALNDYYHDDQCACSEWPTRCASSGNYFFGAWDTNAFAIALPAIIAAYEKQKTARADTARIERGTLIGCDFGGCNQCEWDALAEGRGWERHAALGKWYCPTHKATIVGES